MTAGPAAIVPGDTYHRPNSIPRSRLPFSRSKVFELLKTGQLASIKVDGVRLIPDSAIDAYLSRHVEQAA